jgi:two-component system response regulator DegU
VTSGIQHPAGKSKFLIVDDHAAFRQTIRAFLPAGAVVECTDGAAALACYAAEKPDWVLMDIEMAGKDGLSATRELKARFPEARVIIVSNHGGAAFHHAAKEIGTCGFVHKEHLEELSALITAGEQNQIQS